MIAIDRIAGSGPARIGLDRGFDARSALAQTVSDIAGRIDAWAGLVAGRNSDPASVDRAALKAGGDLYGLRTIAADLARGSGASITEEGVLLAALEAVASQAALRLFGLVGADASTRMADLAVAVDDALMRDVAGSPAEQLIGRLEHVARQLEAGA